MSMWQLMHLGIGRTVYNYVYYVHLAYDEILEKDDPYVHLI